MKFLLAVLLFFLAALARAGELSPGQSADVNTMLRLAEQAQLAQSSEWLKINLYHRSLGGIVSRVDDPSYFMAADGKHDPHAELQATIRNAFNDAMAEHSRQPNVCRWIARYQFLSRSMKALGFSYMPLRCDGFEQWKSGIASYRASLIFASVYLNSPSSMYGHAFIRFDSESSGAYNRLNDATVSYSVQGSDGNGAWFLVKSLFGGYPGAFEFAPYYVKMREYADLENRDLWEYQTNLSGPEIERMLAFIWEQSFSYTDYYFFDDNCALMLLAAFEAARPSLDLINRAKPWFIPLDMVKLIEQAGVIEKVHYRPSQFNTLEYNYRAASEPEKKLALALLDDDQEMPALLQMNASEQATVLDLSLAVSQYQRNQKHTAAEASAIAARQLALSGVRSKISAESRYENKTEPAERPDQGHGSTRVGLAAGQVGNTTYTRINFRGAYHDDLDPQGGFAQGAGTSLGNLFLRYDAANQLRFERLDLFDVFSPSLRTAWARPMTIKLNVSLRREVLQNDELAPTALRLQAATGLSYAAGESLRYYLLADSVSSLNANSYLALGPTLGASWAISPRMRSSVSGNAYWNAFGDQQHSLLYRFAASLAWDVVDNQNNLRLDFLRQTQSNAPDDSRTFSEIGLAYSHYF